VGKSKERPEVEEKGGGELVEKSYGGRLLVHSFERLQGEGHCGPLRRQGRMRGGEVGAGKFFLIKGSGLNMGGRLWGGGGGP